MDTFEKGTIVKVRDVRPFDGAISTKSIGHVHLTMDAGCYIKFSHHMHYVYRDNLIMATEEEKMRYLLEEQ